MGHLSPKLRASRKALTRFAARKAFESYIRRGIVAEPLAALTEAASDEQKFLALCAGLSTKALSNGKATSHYTWRTAGDEKVRDAHAALAGQVFSWSSPPPGGHPGTEHNCRCWAEPYYGDPTVPDSLLHLVRNRQTVSDPDQRIASIETLTRPDGSIAASSIDMVDGTSVRSVFQGPSVSQLVSFPDGASYQSLRMGQAQELTVRWDGETVLRVAQLRLFAPGAPPPLILPPPVSPVPGSREDALRAAFAVAPVAFTVRAAVELYNAAVAQPQPMGEDPDSLSVIAIKTWQGVGADGSVVVTKESLTAEQVAQTCKKLPDVQDWTNAAARVLAPMRLIWSPQKYGTALHTAVHHGFTALKLQFPTRYYNVWSELSVLPDGANSAEEEGAYYGEAGSTRLDVIERVDGTTVCVYDIKTGKRGLSMTRVLDLGSAGLKYSGANTGSSCR